MASSRGRWLKWRLTIRFRDLLLGGIPLDPEVIDKWINANPNLRELVEADRARIAQEHKDETAQSLTPDQLEDLKATMLTGFRRDDSGYYLETRQVRACFREAATTSGMFIRLRGSGQQVGLKQTLQHGFVVKPVPNNGKGALYLGDTVDETLHSVAHVTGAQGARSCFKMAQAMRGRELTFDAWVMNNGAVDEDVFAELLEYVGEVGLGKDRSQDQGKFDVLAHERLE